MTRQMADDEVLRVLDDAVIELRRWTRAHGQCVGTMEVLAKLREAKPAVAALQAERDQQCTLLAAGVERELNFQLRAERAESALEALRGQVAGLGNSLREMLELREATQAGRLTERHELDIVRDARAALLAIKERKG